MTFWAQKHRPGWWKNAVLYQIYPKSFQDANGDGIGDLPGITARLDYLQTLGVDALWLSPIFASPQVDNGYDISDYRAVDPMFGTLDDLRALIRAADARGIGIVLDLVLNHTSDRHRWFQEAKKSKDNPCHDYYIWRDGTPDTPPNGMKATFGGPAWTWVPELGQYYFHQFAPQQPDLNWENPAVRRALYDMINFWIAEGIAGFRLDVIDQIAKEPDNGITANGPRLMEFLRELNRETFGGKDLVTVGEAWGADLARARQYSAPDGSVFSMVFQFEQMVLDQDGSKWKARPWALPELKASIAKWQQGLHGAGWNSLFWNNHDLPRIVSRWGDDGAHRADSAKALAVVLHGLQGTPYIYQGEELGMTNAPFGPQDWRDLESLNAYRELCQTGTPPPQALAAVQRMARDNARTPDAVDSGPQRRVYHRHAVDARQPQLYGHQRRSRTGGPRLGVLHLPETHCAAQNEPRVCGGRFHAAVPRRYAGVRLPAPRRRADDAGGRQPERAGRRLCPAGGLCRRAARAGHAGRAHTRHAAPVGGGGVYFVSAAV